MVGFGKCRLSVSRTPRIAENGGLQPGNSVLDDETSNRADKRTRSLSVGVSGWYIWVSLSARP
jgi:hypothetical protein